MFFIEINNAYFYSNPLSLPIYIPFILVVRISASCRSHICSRIRRCASWIPNCHIHWFRLCSSLYIRVRQIKSSPCAFNVCCVQLHSYDIYPHIAHRLLVWELSSSSPRRSIQRNCTKKVEIRPSILVAVL
jgi:hypothetical protein